MLTFRPAILVFSLLTLFFSGCAEQKKEASPKSDAGKIDSAKIETEDSKTSLALIGSTQVSNSIAYSGACVEAVGDSFTRTNSLGIQETCTIIAQNYSERNVQPNT